MCGAAPFTAPIELTPPGLGDQLGPMLASATDDTVTVAYGYMPLDSPDPIAPALVQTTFDPWGAWPSGPLGPPHIVSPGRRSAAADALCDRQRRRARGDRVAERARVRGRPAAGDRRRGLGRVGAAHSGHQSPAARRSERAAFAVSVSERRRSVAFVVGVDGRRQIAGPRRGSPDLRRVDALRLPRSREPSTHRRTAPRRPLLRNAEEDSSDRGTVIHVLDATTTRSVLAITRPRTCACSARNLSNDRESAR